MNPGVKLRIDNFHYDLTEEDLRVRYTTMMFLDDVLKAWGRICSRVLLAFAQSTCSMTDRIAARALVS